MKKDKARLKIQGQTLLDRQFDLAFCLTGNSDRVWVSGRADGRRYLLDQWVGVGPLGGIHAALQSLRIGNWILILPIDMPFLDVPLLKKLLTKCECDSEIEAVHFENYELPLCLTVSEKSKAALESLLEAPEHSLRSIRNFLLALKTRTVSVKPQERIKLINVNTPHQWRQYCESKAFFA